MILSINSIHDVENITLDLFLNHQVHSISILGVDMTRAEGKYILASKLENPNLKQHASEYDILNTAYWVFNFKECFLGNLYINNAFRANLSSNDIIILKAIFLLSLIAERLKQIVK